MTDIEILRGKKILVVDDELSMRELLEVVLGREGYNVTLTRSGDEALRLLEAGGFDLVITDIRMEGVSGLEVLKRAEASGRTTAEEAVALADELMEEPHPLWPHRGQVIINRLVQAGWDRGDK